MSDDYVSPATVEELTNRKKFKAQCRALARLGIPFRPNAVGRPLVERAVVLSSAAQAPKPKAKRGPNWDALNGTPA